jgi:hypothetical protein
VHLLADVFARLERHQDKLRQEWRRPRLGDPGADVSCTQENIATPVIGVGWKNIAFPGPDRSADSLTVVSTHQSPLERLL